MSLEFPRATAKMQAEGPRPVTDLDGSAKAVADNALHLAKCIRGRAEARQAYEMANRALQEAIESISDGYSGLVDQANAEMDR